MSYRSAKSNRPYTQIIYTSVPKQLYLIPFLHRYLLIQKANAQHNDETLEPNNNFNLKSIMPNRNRTPCKRIHAKSNHFLYAFSLLISVSFRSLRQAIAKPNTRIVMHAFRIELDGFRYTRQKLILNGGKGGDGWHIYSYSSYAHFYEAYHN